MSQFDECSGLAGFGEVYSELPMGIYVCSECKEPYHFTSGGGGPHQSREEYWCPHCGSEQGSEKTEGVPQTRKLTADELADWTAEQAKLAK